MPQVSVIMPCFNHARFLEESANGILGQSLKDLELIIVDDCSSDNSWEVIQRLAARDGRVKCIRHDSNRGASKSRNDGMRAAQGEFVGFCDADDIWERDKLRLQVELLRDHADYDVTYCDSIIIDENGQSKESRFSQLFPLPSSASGFLFAQLLKRNFVNMQSVLMRAQCIEQVGYFDEKIKWVEDWWYWVRVSRHHRFMYCRDALARYRVHAKSTNQIHRRGCGINRFKVFKRIWQNYPELSWRLRSDIAFQMGVELCNLQKVSAGRRWLWSAFWKSLPNPRTILTSVKAFRRLLMSVGKAKGKIDLVL
jgi:glycosyltransferase involved in cell wall biosynthesis